MYLDNRVLFSDQQAITATANSTNSIDLGANGTTYDGIALRRNKGLGMMIPLLIEVTETFNNLTSLALVCQNATDVAFTTPLELFRVVVLLAQLKKGYVSPIEVMPRGVTNRYLRLRYEVVGTAPSTGKISAGIVAAVDGAYRGNPA